MTSLLARSLRGIVPAMRVFPQFLPYMKGEGRRLGLATLTMVGASLATLAMPIPIALVFDGVLFRKRATGLSEWVKGIDHDQGTGTALAMLAAAFLVIVGIAAALDFARVMLSADVAQRVVYRVRRAAFANLMRQPPAFYKRQRSGDLLMRLSGDVAMLRDMLVPAVLDGAQQTIVLVGMVVVIVAISPKLALVALGVIPLLGITFVLGGRRLTEVSREQRKREGRLAAWAAEAFHAMSVVQAFGREKDVEERFGASNRKSLKAGLKARRIEAGIGRTVDVLTGIGTCGVLVWGAFEVRALTLSAGELLVVMAYLRQVYRPLRTFGKISARTAKAAACGERVLECLSLRASIADAPDAQTLPAIVGEIELEDVTVEPEPGIRALDRVSLRIRPRERVALVGPSGSGKSTLLSLIPRLVDPSAGIVRIDGHDLRSVRLVDLRRGIAVAFQEPGLLGDTLRDNVAFGAEGANEEEIERAARRAGVDLVARTRELGLDAPVAERGAALSGGERQRVSLARMALRDAPIVLLDEPFSSLDAERRASLEETLEPLLVGRTAIVATHHLDRLAAFDRVVVLDRGRVVGDGPPAQVVERCETLRTLMRSAAAPAVPAAARRVPA